MDSHTSTLDHVLLVAPLQQRNDRSKRFLAHNLRVLRRVINDGDWDIQPVRGIRVDVSANSELVVVGMRVLEIRNNLLVPAARKGE